MGDGNSLDFIEKYQISDDFGHNSPVIPQFNFKKNQHQ
jgi:hypothetical protein